MAEYSDSTLSDVSPVAIVGLHGGEWFGAQAEQALREADVLVGSVRIHEELPADFKGERVELFGPLDEVIDLIEQRRSNGERVVMLASGDPGFFGIERLLVGRFGSNVSVFPAPSSVSLAFARAGIPWDDAAVVSCHGRSLGRALPHILAAPKVAGFVAASCPPEVLGQALCEANADHTHVWVCSRMGERDESITATDLKGLAAGTFDPLSVVVLTTHAQPIGAEASVVWGQPTASFKHRASMITKPEVRAVALSKLELNGAATLWDVGASSGSISVEAARLAPGLRAFAIERNAQDCERIRANASRVPVTVVHGEAPDCFDDLPDPDRLFVGGGGATVFTRAVKRVRPGGQVVATFAVLASALAAADVLDEASMVQVCINQAVPIGPDGDLRFNAENPVFVVWGQV